MAVFAHMNDVRVEVWEDCTSLEDLLLSGRSTFKCISGFGDSQTVINVCYDGAVHYDALSLSE